MCVCVCVCVIVYMKKSVCAHVWRPEDELIIPLRYHLPCSMRQGVSLRPGPYCLGCAGWPEFPGSAISTA